MKDRQLKMREIAEAVGMSSEWVYHILIAEKLRMKKNYLQDGYRRC